MKGLAQTAYLVTGRSFPDSEGAPAMKPLSTDALWERLEPLLPPPPPTPPPLSWTQAFGLSENSHRHPLRPQDRYCLGRLARRTGLWLRQDLPGVSRALAPKPGVWTQLHAMLLAELNGADQINWRRALIDASFAKAPEGRGYRPEPHGSRPIREQAPRADRCQGDPARGDGNGG